MHFDCKSNVKCKYLRMNFETTHQQRQRAPQRTISGHDSDNRNHKANANDNASTMRGIRLEEIWYQILVPELSSDLMFKGTAE